MLSKLILHSQIGNWDLALTEYSLTCAPRKAIKGKIMTDFIVSPRGIPTKFKFRVKDHFSNNDVEYEALIVGLEILLDLGGKRVVIKGDL